MSWKPRRRIALESSGVERAPRAKGPYRQAEDHVTRRRPRSLHHLPRAHCTDSGKPALDPPSPQPRRASIASQYESELTTSPPFRLPRAQ
jgi:hypothetical protein